MMARDVLIVHAQRSVLEALRGLLPGEVAGVLAAALVGVALTVERDRRGQVLALAHQGAVDMLARVEGGEG